VGPFAKEVRLPAFHSMEHDLAVNGVGSKRASGSTGSTLAPMAEDEEDVNHDEARGEHSSEESFADKVECPTSPTGSDDKGFAFPEAIPSQPKVGRLDSWTTGSTSMPARRLSSTSAQSTGSGMLGRLRGNMSSGVCGCLFKKRIPPFQQTLVLLRHSERQDYVDPTYKESPEGIAWPNDAPLTKAGFKLAAKVSKELLALHLEVNFAAVIVSPFRRCLETAAEVSRRLKIPTMIDQEIGEVWDPKMPKIPHPCRKGLELKELAARCKLQPVNPFLDDGGIKCYGKEPNYPETLEDARRRFTIRTETYIQRSAETKQNFILCTHADCVAAVLAMFERGNADIKEMDFCARIIARRTVEASKKASEASEYAKEWTVTHTALKAEIMDAQGMEKYYEKMHLSTCEEHNKSAVVRRNNRTKTDNMFDKDLGALRTQFADIPEGDEGMTMSSEQSGEHGPNRA